MIMEGVWKAVVVGAIYVGCGIALRVSSKDWRRLSVANAAIMTGALILAVCAFLFGAHGAFARDDGRYAQSPLKPWFDQLRSKKGACCSDADGTALTDTDWDSKDGHYRVRIEDQWWDVPDEAVITEPNRVGRTMVWPVYSRWPDHLTVDIRCFMPGSMS